MCRLFTRTVGRVCGVSSKSGATKSRGEPNSRLARADRTIALHPARRPTDIYNTATMRHPFLRILAALLIGLSWPACCCRASAMLGGVCGGTHETAAQPDDEGCSDSCCGHKADDTPTDVPSQQPHSPDAPCPSCPSCLGVVTSVGVPSQAKADLDVGLSLLNVAVCVPSDSLSCCSSSVTPLTTDGWTGPRPFLRSNRAAQRWHCALIV